MTALPPEIDNKTSGDGRTFWNRHASSYDRSMRWLGRPLPRMTELVLDEVRGLDEVLEVGAGTGLVTVPIARAVARLVATDYAEGMLERLRARITTEGLENVEVLARDVAALGFAPERFDAVVCANVLHLVPDMDAALSALRAAVKPSGKLIAPTFCHGQSAKSRWVSRALALAGFPQRRRLTMTTLAAAVERAGFHVVKTDLIAGPLPIGFVTATPDGRQQR